MAETFEGLYVKFGANTVEFDRSCLLYTSLLYTSPPKMTKIDTRKEHDFENQ